MNDKNRITKPLLKKDGAFKEVSFEEAYQVILDRIKGVKPDDNAFFAGARLSNEEMYLVQKLARVGAKTNNITSFHYLNRGIGYKNNATANVPFDELKGASKIYLLGSEINRDNAVVGFIINDAQHRYNIPVSLVTTLADSTIKHKVDEVLDIKSYYHFIKAVNYYLVANGFHNALFINDNTEGFETYKEAILKENFSELIEKAGVRYMDQVIEFAKAYNNEMNAVVVFSEKELSSNACAEIYNLAMITGKLGKTSNGVVSLKEKNNAQGLFDMGVCMKLGVGGAPIDDMKLVNRMKQSWKVKDLPSVINPSLYQSLEEGALKNIFIFGEDPLGCAHSKVHVAGWLSVADFVVVQDYFMTETAEHAQLILPASFPIESGGSFTNTQKVVQEFDAAFNSRLECQSWEQIKALLEAFGSTEKQSINEVMMEAVSLLPDAEEKVNHHFLYTEGQNCNRIYDYGCDYINKRFEEEFQRSFQDN